MKKQVISFLFLTYSLLAFSQNWQSVGGGTDMTVRGLYSDSIEDKLYIVGNFPHAGDTLVNQVAVWNGNVWNKVGNGTGDTGCLYGCNPIISALKYNNDLYVSGMQVIMDGVFGDKYTSMWNGATWQSCGSPNNLTTMNVANDTLFALGGFDTIGAQNILKIAKWNGTSWQQFGAPFPDSDPTSFPLYVQYYNNQYYFGGNFTGTGNLKEIIRWDGNQWQPLMLGLLGDSYVTDMVVYDSLLYVGGWFHKSDGNIGECIMAWDGNQWINPFPPDVYYFNGIADLAVIEDKLYISGNFLLLNDTSMFTLAHFDGTNFCAFGGRANYPDWAEIPPVSIAGLDGNFYIACNVTYWGDTVNYIAQWMGGDSVDACITVPTSIKEIVETQNFVLFPNPASSSITIEFNDVEKEDTVVEIRNILGQTVQVLRLEKGSKKTELDVSELSKGLFFVQVQGKTSITSKRFIKE